MTKTQIVFGHRYGPFPRLYSELIEYETGDGLSYIWKQFIENADEPLLEDLLAVLRTGRRTRNTLLISAICYGYDGMTSPLGKSKKLKRTTRRFTYHAMATIDTVCFLEGLGDESKTPLRTTEYVHLIRTIQTGYSWLTPPSKARPDGPLNSEEALLANAFVIANGIGRDGVRESAVQVIADNYEELRPYFKLLYSSEKTSDGVEAILATTPVIALTAGAL